MRDLTKEALDMLQKHVDETGSLPDLSTPESRGYTWQERKETGDRIQHILSNLERQPFPEELELLRAVRAGQHWINSDFWGPYLMVWDVRLKHYQANEDAYRKKGIRICRTTQVYSFHACEVSEVQVTDLHENELFVAEPIYGEKSAWDAANGKMKENGFTHYLHKGALPVNSGATPYYWMDIISVEFVSPNAQRGSST